MEIVFVVGRTHVDFTDNSGKRICGWSIYYTMQDDRTEGVMCGKYFVSDEKAASLDIPSPNTKCEVSYDRYGRPSRFTVIK